ncbi:MAG TPA: CBS domain-containing protein, partial [Candidatus Obscuribacterales bacterium]
MSAFPLHKAIDRYPVTVTPDTPVLQVVMLMSQARASCVLVVEQQQLVGIFTERDVVRVTAAGIALEGVAIASVMTPQIITLQESQAEDILAVLSLLRQYRIRHLPIVDNLQQLVGVLTHESMREVLQPADLLKLRSVSDVMTNEVIHTSLTASVLHLAQLMSANNVSCVLIVNPESKEIIRPLGIVTERDIVQLRALGLDLSQIQAQTVMSAPLLPIRPKDSLWAAHKKMLHHHIRRLIVVDDAGNLVGIVTQTNMLQVLDPMETYAALEALQRVVEERTFALQKTNQQLQSEIIERQQIETELRLSQARLAGILNSADDAIISVDESQRIQTFNLGAEKIFGYTADEILGQPLDMLFSQTLIGAHCSYSNQGFDYPDVARKIGEYREVFGRRKNGTEFPAEASLSESPVGEEIVLTVILRDITERKANEEVLRNQLARERLMGKIGQCIRQSFNLEKIFNTTVTEVREFLEADRVIIYQFQADWSGLVVAESLNSGCIPLLGKIIKDHCFAEKYVEFYQQGRIQATADIYNADLTQCHIDILASLQIRANLVVPILQGEKLWGLMGVHQCFSSRQWQQMQIDLLKQLATQVGIAIQQVQLYHKLEEANQELQRLA